MRYELFGDKNANYLFVGAFGKKLINPIEQVQLPAASGQLMSFDNTNNGTVAGAEIEFSYGLKQLLKKAGSDKNPLKNISIGGNIAYIHSKIDVNDTTGFTTNAIRPLQGASPLLANVLIRYDKKIVKRLGENERKVTSFSTALSMTYTSKTLFAVGIQGIGDQYRFPTYQLNWTSSYELNKRLKISFICRNLLDTRFELYQQDMVNQGEWQLVNAYRRGIDFSFKLTYSMEKKK